MKIKHRISPVCQAFFGHKIDLVPAIRAPRESIAATWRRHEIVPAALQNRGLIAGRRELDLIVGSLC
jgi:hypothetical protein